MRSDLNIPESAVYGYEQMQSAFMNEDVPVCEDCGDEEVNLTEVNSFITVREYFPPLQIREVFTGSVRGTTTVRDGIKRELRTVRKPCTKLVCDECKSNYEEGEE